MVWQIVYTGFHTVMLGNVPTVCVSVVKNSVQLTTLRFGVKVTLIIHSSQILREHNVSYQILPTLAIVKSTYRKAPLHTMFLHIQGAICCREYILLCEYV